MTMLVSLHNPVLSALGGHEPKVQCRHRTRYTSEADCINQWHSGELPDTSCQDLGQNVRPQADLKSAHRFQQPGSCCIHFQHQ